MSADSLTGSRIRERRLMRGLRQADLARDVGISASYLNLIEHNRRRIGGKLLLELAQALGVEPSLLTQGAEISLLTSLREAADDARVAHVELDRVEEFAGRFPGWAEILKTTHAKVADLERAVRTLSDRLTHDPYLAASVHEVLSTATSIRSTAAILAEPGLEEAWQKRFTGNLKQDSERLAESSRQLASVLEQDDKRSARRGAPLEEVEAFFIANNYFFDSLEGLDTNFEDLVANAPELETNAARNVALRRLEDCRADAVLLPQAKLIAAVHREGLHPDRLLDELDVPMHLLLKRLAMLPTEQLGQQVGMVLADASGAMLDRRSVPGFTVPRFGAGCPLWPLFAALARPGLPIHRRLTQPERSNVLCDCYAIAWDARGGRFEGPPVLRSVMLIVAQEVSDESARMNAEVVGANCRICAKQACAARREPSIIRDPEERSAHAGDSG